MDKANNKYNNLFLEYNRLNEEFIKIKDKLYETKNELNKSGDDINELKKYQKKYNDQNTKMIEIKNELNKKNKNINKLRNNIFFPMLVFFHEHSRITGLQGKGEGISLIPHYHFHPLHRHLDISRAITAESSPLDIASSRTRTGNLWFPRASH